MAQLPTTDKDQVHQQPGQSVTASGLRMVPPNDRTLWMGNIKDGMDEKYIVDSFGAESVGIVGVKITKEKYCFYRVRFLVSCKHGFEEVQVPAASRRIWVLSAELVQ